MREKGWLLHQGVAYSDLQEVRGAKRQCAPLIRLFQYIVQTNKKMRLHNQDRLRELGRYHPEIQIFSAYNPFEYCNYLSK